ncbi:MULTISPECIES: bifunctional 3-(3-hydroxy-phenyl)propionate/3-hydroxycinnamic acid hydroxylase [Bradyrhizobium]|uniref:bifunctional 3-(3-hydroxy-phenyl)propionate/3-hydroxycinnamic acid hydroxylase n=1 Tax=Bradyrhizobium TaxID=374 RepID=UPI0003F819BD|nr:MULTISPECIES: bifunctional 3-(3-hydroxy-phenyl)propionate/3-hydroxycinnamic acid hydroxylase [Bradyrhizobium]QOG18668.1 bifunctional 3-(3-hydroxy-phenyl)propionate/3-hydroxycinnamic acid hydroxylase [Bradyrhizobium sp. SEMIA]UFW47275.1 bifunctional 3-(3-hydroxy-phenyl)propionate/3-hydroxycinnamic acid hydroxylase [Bradyrhizobium arachidis]
MTDMAGATDYDVLVVGFGPTGAVAAGQLGRLGHRTLVIDRLTDVYDKPRAIALDHEIFRQFDNMGLADAISPFIEPFTASEHFGVDGQLIRRIDMVAKPYPLGYTPSMVFSQPAVETELRRHAMSFSNVRAELGVELLDLVQTSDRVEARLKDSDGRHRSVTARYVLGCDGASSTVRQIAGLGLEDLVFDEPWLVVDMRVNESALARLPQCSAQFCNPARPVSFLIGPKNHRRWEIMLLPGEDVRQMERPDNVWKLLSPWLTPHDGDLWRAASYRFHALVAADWRSGRILIAGDAAHQQPPFIGQGMCQGLRDATNLVWKLDQVLKGVSSDSLLDSYTVERKQHVIELTGKIKAIGQSICERDPAAARKSDAQILSDGGGKPLLLTRQEIIPPLRAGCLSHQETPARGSLFPQPRIASGGTARLLDEMIGAGWRVLIDGRSNDAASMLSLCAARPDVSATAVAPAGAGRPNVLEETEGVLASWFDRHGVVAAIVRPDHYVFGTARNTSELGDLLREIGLYCRDVPAEQANLIPDQTMERTP